MIGVFSILDGSAQGKTPEEPAQEEHNRQRKRGRTPANGPMAARAPPSAGSQLLQVQIGPPVPTNRYAKVIAPVPDHGMFYGPLSPSSDHTPVSATDPHQYQFQNLYPVAPATGNAFGQHFTNGGVQVQGMGFPGSAPHDALTFDPAYEISLAEVDPYHGGMMPSDDPSQFSYGFDGYTAHGHAYYPQEHVSSEFCSGPYSEAQLTNPNGHVMTAPNYAGSSVYPDSNGQYTFYPPNFGQ